MRKKNLYDDIKFEKGKYLFYKKEYSFDYLKEKIDYLAKSISSFKKGVVAINAKDKLDFIIKFYALNKSGFKIFLSESNSLENLKKEKIEINYIFKNKKLTKYKKIKKKINNNVSIILKTSGSTDFSKYVFLKNENITFIATEMNSQIFEKKKKYNELIFAPIDHAFGFGRLHALIMSSHSLTLTNNMNLNNLYNIYNSFNCNCVSLPSKLLMVIIDLNFKKFLKKLPKMHHIHTSTGYFPLKYRKKVLSLKTNLFINYGMTEAMRSTFLNCKKYQNKIHTEGKPFKGVKIKIKKSQYQNGDIFIKGKNLALEYSDKSLWKSKIIDGWFKTGDLGYIDKNGFLIFCGRNQDNVSFNGINYDLGQIEKNLKTEFKITNLKILNDSGKINNFESKLYLFLDKKTDFRKIYYYLKKNNIHFSFEKIIVSKEFNYTKTGKLQKKDFIKLINEKK